MTWFDNETKRAILLHIRGLLRPEGALFFGGVETTLNFNEDLERVVAERTTYYRVKKT